MPPARRGLQAAEATVTAAGRDGAGPAVGVWGAAGVGEVCWGLVEVVFGPTLGLAAREAAGERGRRPPRLGRGSATGPDRGDA